MTLPVPAEWTPHRAMWVGWPSHADLWEENLEPAQAEVEALVRALAGPGREQVKLMVGNDEALADAQARFADVAGVTVVAGRFGDIWLRDTGPIFGPGSASAQAFVFNGWGGKYDLPHDDEVADQIGVGFLGAGFDPLWTREQVPVMPKGRYDIMRAYMPKVGTLGLDMMLRTCTIQANLDFDSEADMVMKFRTSLALQPIATALFANSPFTEGKPNGFLSARANVWTDTDADRTGMLGFVFEDGFGFERYADYALDTPMYFAKRDGRYVDASGQSFRDFQAGKLPALPGQYPTLKDWNDHLTTLFPEVRLKQYLEMRGADGGPWSRICALPALWAGILYDAPSLAAAWDLCKDWDIADHERLRRDVTRLGMKAEVNGRSVRDIAVDMVNIAKQGLKNRARFSGGMVDERGYITELEDIADSGVTSADRLLELYNGEWSGDVSRVYRDMAY